MLPYNKKQLMSELRVCDTSSLSVSPIYIRTAKLPFAVNSLSMLIAAFNSVLEKCLIISNSFSFKLSLIISPMTDIFTSKFYFS